MNFINETNVIVKKEINMGDLDDFLDMTNGLLPIEIKVLDGDAIIPAGTRCKIKGETNNDWYEIKISGVYFDLALDYLESYIEII